MAEFTVKTAKRADGPLLAPPEAPPPRERPAGPVDTVPVLPRPAHTRPRALTLAMPLVDAIQSLFDDALERFLVHAAALGAQASVRNIHQMRVGIRRFRAVRAGFRQVIDTQGMPSWLDPLGGLFARLGEVRAADVFRSDTLHRIGPQSLAPELCAVLDRAAGQYREAALARVQADLASPAFADAAAGAQSWVAAKGWQTEAVAGQLAATVPAFARARPGAAPAAAQVRAQGGQNGRPRRVAPGAHRREEAPVCLCAAPRRGGAPEERGGRVRNAP